MPDSACCRFAGMRADGVGKAAFCPAGRPGIGGAPEISASSPWLSDVARPVFREFMLWTAWEPICLRPVSGAARGLGLVPLGIDFPPKNNILWVLSPEELFELAAGSLDVVDHSVYTGLHGVYDATDDIAGTFEDR